MAKYIIILLFTGLFYVTAINSNAIKLADIKTLTLKVGSQTTGRRSSPVPQLQCTGYLCNYAPDTIQCTNKGTDGVDVQWACEADLPNTLSLSLHSMNCEGFKYPTDDYVLVGSCSLSYHLNGHVQRKNDIKGSTSSDIFTFFAIITIISIFCCGCQNRRIRYTNNGYDDLIVGAATGATAATFLRPRRRRYGWTGGWPRRRSGGSSILRTGKRRKAVGFCGTTRR